MSEWVHLQLHQGSEERKPSPRKWDLLLSSRSVFCCCSDHTNLLTSEINNAAAAVSTTEWGLHEHQQCKPLPTPPAGEQLLQVRLLVVIVVVQTFSICAEQAATSSREGMRDFSSKHIDPLSLHTLIRATGGVPLAAAPHTP